MKVDYLYDMDPRYGWASIDLEESKTGLIVIHGPNGSEGFEYSDGEMKPVCICHAYYEGECSCSHLPHDYWE